jgi:hypothetical protein
MNVRQGSIKVTNFNEQFKKFIANDSGSIEIKQIKLNKADYDISYSLESDQSEGDSP